MCEANWSPPTSSSPLMIRSGNNPGQKWKSGAQQNWSRSLQVMTDETRAQKSISIFNWNWKFACDEKNQDENSNHRFCSIACDEDRPLHCKLEGIDQKLNFVFFRIDCPRLFDSHVAVVPSVDQLLRFHSAETVIGQWRTIDLTLSWYLTS